MPDLHVIDRSLILLLALIRLRAIEVCLMYLLLDRFRSRRRWHIRSWPAVLGTRRGFVEEANAKIQLATPCRFSKELVRLTW